MHIYTYVYIYKYIYIYIYARPNLILGPNLVLGPRVGPGPGPGENRAGWDPGRVGPGWDHRPTPGRLANSPKGINSKGNIINMYYFIWWQ